MRAVDLAVLPSSRHSHCDAESSGEPNMCGHKDESATNCNNSRDKPTAEMKQPVTFEGWDFINVWNTGEGQTYPYLRTDLGGDVNKDGVVSFLDLYILAERWME